MGDLDRAIAARYAKGRAYLYDRIAVTWEIHDTRMAHSCARTVVWLDTYLDSAGCVVSNLEPFYSIT